MKENIDFIDKLAAISGTKIDNIKLLWDYLFFLNTIENNNKKEVVFTIPSVGILTYKNEKFEFEPYPDFLNFINNANKANVECEFIEKNWINNIIAEI
jgi:hypothetical protein